MVAHREARGNLRRCPEIGDKIGNWPETPEISLAAGSRRAGPGVPFAADSLRIARVSASWSAARKHLIIRIYSAIRRDRRVTHGDATMGYRRYDLQEAFFVPGSLGFRVWGYGTDDPLEDVLRPGYFALAGAQLRPGELIFARMRPARPRRAGAGPRPPARQSHQEEGRAPQAAGQSAGPTPAGSAPCRTYPLK
jgi:hypothetical protein